MVQTIDLRSDTVTQPTPEMRLAMAEAEVGDDVFGEDPSVNKLERMSADLMGMESGVFVASGTMGNLVAILTHCGRGDEVILGNLSHSFLYEAGGMAALGGVHPRTVQNQEDGTMRLDEIERAIRPDDPHFPISRLIIIENTHNRTGGSVLSVKYTQEVAELARKKKLSLHIDGARIFNAAVALGVEARHLAEPAHSITFCLSKALCAPVGSVLCGSDDFIKKARRIRKQLGGGMRQAGFLAAAGIVALQKMIHRLEDDHLHAKSLAKGLRGIKGLSVEKDPPPSNMVYCTLDSNLPITSYDLAQKFKSRGILIGTPSAQRIRMVLHYWITDDGISQIIDCFREIFNGI